MSLEIRDARREDLAVLWELLHGLAEYERMTEVVSGTREQLGRLMFDEPGGLFGLIAWDGDRPIGYALFFDTFSSFRTARTTWLEDLFLKPEARGSGAGRALLAEVARRALARESRLVAWDVLDWNQLAVDFYERQGARHAPVEWLEYRLDEAGMRALAASIEPGTPRPADFRTS